jgi:hypothetical protein
MYRKGKRRQSHRIMDVLTLAPWLDIGGKTSMRCRVSVWQACSRCCTESRHRFCFIGPSSCMFGVQEISVGKGNRGAHCCVHASYTYDPALGVFSSAPALSMFLNPPFIGCKSLLWRSLSRRVRYQYYLNEVRLDDRVT